MRKLSADRFEEIVRQMLGADAVVGGAGEPFESLVQTAAQLALLAEPPPPAPGRLQPGRQLLVAEASRIRSEQAASARRRMTSKQSSVRLAVSALAVVVVAILLFGAVRAVSASGPGDLCYGLDLAMERIRLSLTIDRQARVEVGLALVEERLDELLELTASGQPVDELSLARVQRRLSTTLQDTAALDDEHMVSALSTLEAMLDVHQEAMSSAMAGSATPRQNLLQETAQFLEQVRQEIRTGREDPAEFRNRLRLGMPTGAVDDRPPLCTLPPESTPVHRLQPTGSDSVKGAGPQTDRDLTAMPFMPKETAEAPAGNKPLDGPKGPKSTNAPGSILLPEGTAGELCPTGQSGSTPGLTPTDGEVGPNLTDRPGENPGPGSSPDPASGAERPTEQPPSGAGPGPTGTPGEGNPSGQPGPDSSPEPVPGSGGGQHGKP